jgi:regulatory protein
MPRITSLTGSRRTGRVELEVDGEAWGSVPDSIALSCSLHEGQVLDEEELEALREEIALAEAVNAALSCLAYRPRSRVELQRHLRRKGHAEGPVQAAISRCERLGYIDDGAFALSFVRDRIRFRPSGRRRLLSELRSRGISGEDADAALDEAFREFGFSERDLLRQSAARRVRALQSVERSTARRRLTGYLLRRGFAGADVRSIVDELLPDSERS